MTCAFDEQPSARTASKSATANPSRGLACPLRSNYVAPYSGSPSARRASASLAEQLRRWLPRRVRRSLPLDLPTHFSGPQAASHRDC